MQPYYADDWLTVYLGDCRAVLAELPADSVHCVITSPPYYGLRDYGVAGQIGLEPTPEQYVVELVAMFREVRRVLRPDGTVWLNLGDSYAGSWGAQGREGQMADRSVVSARQIAAHPLRSAGLKPKDRMMIPARVALALQADGWWLRDEIVWAKPNPMPSSVTDRTTPAHEMVYLLTKRARYWYDADAIREPHGAKVVLREPPERVVTAETVQHLIAGGASADLVEYARRRVKTERDPNVRGVRQAPEPGELGSFHEAGRNKRSVWTIATQPYPEAHFATFPEALVEPMILAGCPEGGTVLDPFAGSGTVGLVAQRHSRRAVLIDLSAEYMRQLLVRNAAIPLGLSGGEPLFLPGSGDQSATTTEDPEAA